MKVYSCKTHADHALDVVTADRQTYPIFEELTEEEKLSTKCEYCEEPATYVVANE